jgi:hypothetical protein
MQGYVYHKSRISLSLLTHIVVSVHSVEEVDASFVVRGVMCMLWPKLLHDIAQMQCGVVTWEDLVVGEEFFDASGALLDMSVVSLDLLRRGCMHCCYLNGSYELHEVVKQFTFEIESVLGVIAWIILPS